MRTPYFNCRQLRLRAAAARRLETREQYSSVCLFPALSLTASLSLPLSESVIHSGCVSLTFSLSRLFSLFLSLLLSTFLPSLSLPLCLCFSKSFSRSLSPSVSGLFSLSLTSGCERIQACSGATCMREQPKLQSQSPLLKTKACVESHSQSPLSSQHLTW